MTTRENALYWWAKVPILLAFGNTPTQRSYVDAYLSKDRIVSSLTGSEIETIWEAEGCPMKLYTGDEVNAICEEAIKNDRESQKKVTELFGK